MGDSKFLGIFRQLAEELRGLHGELDHMIDAAKKTPSSESDGSLRLAALRLVGYVQDNVTDIARLFALLRNEIDRDDNIRDYWGDVFTRVDIDWRRVRYH